jgi:hypothetical protein
VSTTAAVAAALCGRSAAVGVREMIEQGGSLTPWGRAALCTVESAIADADGVHGRAADLLVEAAALYARMPNTTEQMFCLALAAGALTRAGQTERADQMLTEVRAFALRNRAPGLLRMAESGRPDTAWSPDLAS